MNIHTWSNGSRECESELPRTCVNDCGQILKCGSTYHEEHKPHRSAMPDYGDEQENETILKIMNECQFFPNFSLLFPPIDPAKDRYGIAKFVGFQQTIAMRIPKVNLSSPYSALDITDFGIASNCRQHFTLGEHVPLRLAVIP